MSSLIKISASLLSANFARLGEEIVALEKAGVDMIHIDVMDGHFVPNLTLGPPVIKSLRPYSKLLFDVHLMINAPEYTIKDYVDAGADIITIHPETTKHLDRTLNYIQSLGVKVGISLLPSSLPESLDYIINKLDMILVMTVNPGFAGQHFITDQLKKVEIISEKIKQVNKSILLSVDGGINNITAQDCIKAGANVLVAGTFIFQAPNYKNQIDLLRE